MCKELIDCRRQVPSEAEIPIAKNHLGRRGNVLLFQREIEKYFKGLVREQSVSFSKGQTGIGRSYRSDDHSSQQLVQESTAKG